MISPSFVVAAITLVLKARLVVPAADAPSISPGMVLIEGDRILSVGSALEVPAGAVVLDLGDVTLLRGSSMLRAT